MVRRPGNNAAWLGLRCGRAAAAYALLLCWSASAVFAQSTLVKVADGRLVAAELARIINRGVLIVALHEKDTPPFFYEKDGVLVGFDIELVQRIGDQLKVPLQFDRSAKT